MKVKVFLNGGLGFIGIRFIRKYFQEHEIIVYARKKDRQILDKSDVLKNITVEYGSIEDSSLGIALEKHKPEVVIHLAALTGLKKCHDNPQLAFETNVYGTYNLLKNCQQGTKIIFISSREVYGETLNSKSKETDTTKPNNVYGITKLLAEQLVQLESQKNNLDYTILRLTNVYGPEGDQYGAQVIIKDVLRARKVRIMGGSQRLNFVYVDDVVELIGKTLTDSSSSKQIFNVGSDDTITIKEFAQQVIKMQDKDISIEYLPMRNTETSNFDPSLEKLFSIMGFVPKTSLSQGLKNTIGWYQKSLVLE